MSDDRCIDGGPSNDVGSFQRKAPAREAIMAVRSSLSFLIAQSGLLVESITAQ
jgi:hypothetical protein